jgi:hypothetical protein
MHDPDETHLESNSSDLQRYWLGRFQMNPVDNLWTTRRKVRLNPVDKSSVLDSCLTGSLRSARRGRDAIASVSPRRSPLTPHICLLIGTILITTITTANATTSIDHLKLYAHSRIIDYKEFQCFNKIITKESRWRIDAVNGSHYGLGQMRNKKYRTLDGFTQIDWTLRYIKGRYKTSCKAWAFHQQRNHY